MIPMMVDQDMMMIFLPQLPLLLPVRTFGSAKPQHGYLCNVSRWYFRRKFIPCRISAGALLAVSLMVGSYIISKKKHYPKGDKFSFKGLLKQIGISIWALAAVVIVVIGVVAGWFTATESAAIAVFYSLIVSVYIYKGLDWKGVWKCLEQCIDTLSIVLILISTSSIFGYCLTTLHVPDMVANAIVGFSTNPIVIALLIDLILLFLGCIMDMAPIILIATPILLPIATSIGIDPVQFGIIMVLNCGIGLLTPRLDPYYLSVPQSAV